MSDVPYVAALCEQHGLCLQAGGGGGVYPAMLARHFDWVVTVEPSPLNVACVRANVPANVAVIHAAIWDSEGSAEVIEDPSNAGATYIGLEGEIERLTIDSMDLPACNLIWLDIQGAEYFALKGAATTIKKYRPAVVLEVDEMFYLSQWKVDKDSAWRYLTETHAYTDAGQLPHEKNDHLFLP